MEIGKVKFGEYSVGNGQIAPNKKNAGKEEAKEQEVSTQSKQNAVKPDDMYNALGLMGSQNMAFISRSTKVSDLESATNFLGDERVQDIEAMMAEFENGVADVADIIDEEFEGVFDEAERNALAAKIFAQE